MTRLLPLGLLAVLLLGGTGIRAQSLDERVNELLGKMTLKEKAGQMAQLSIDMISVGQPYNLAEPHQLDPEKLKEMVVDYGVGSLLNVGGHAYTREHWFEIHQSLAEATRQTRLQIPILYGIDGIHGQNYTQGAVLFPQQLGQAATWNPALVEQAAAVTAYECRASGIPWNFSPVLDLMRQPLWSRVFETFGEDVYLAKTLGVAAIRGYQGDDISDREKVASCMKHFLGYSFPFTGKDRTPSHMGPLTLREYFVPPFQAAIDAGARTIMINSAEIDGIPVHINPAILQDLLRDEMGFEGMVVSDWEDILLLVSRHRVAKDHKEAIKLAVNAGIDMSMIPLDPKFVDLLVELVQEGEVPMWRIDEAVGRILKLKFELGLFEAPYFEFDYYTKFGSEVHREVAFQAALESLTLLKNENQTLPLAKDARVLVTGPGANSQIMLNGSWSRTWQGTNPNWDKYDRPTILQAIQNKIGVRQVRYVPGTEVDTEIDIRAAVRAARRVDAIVVCVGETPSTEKPGDIIDLSLPAAQIQLVQALARTGKPIILVIAEARPRIIRPIVASCPAILMSYQPGEEGGRALAEVLFGDHNPEGKLPFTYPRAVNDLVPYDRKTTEDIDPNFGYQAFQPEFVFGHGLSYTRFAYSDLSLSRSEIWGNQQLTLSVKVTNTGEISGREVVQVYVRDEVASITPAAKRLRAFRKISLSPGESKTLSFELGPDDLAFVHADLKMRPEGGEFTVFVGDQSAKFFLRE